MKIFRTLDRMLMIRLAISIVLAAAALGLFLMSRSTLPTRESQREELSQTLASEVDREVDSVLARFKIEKGWIKKSVVTLLNTDVKRIERRVVIPRDIVPVQMNVAFNAMAKKYSGRAVASENLKENSVTIHIEMQGYIVQTIILKTNPDLKRGTQKDRQAKA